jgi:L-aspartate oxidase
MSDYQFDYIIIGCGLSGLYSALNASKYGTVALITKTTLELSNSYWAQGGIAAAIHQDDSTQLHFNDTIKAGRGLCNESAVKILVEEGKERILELIEMGMPFDKDNGKIALGLEGGHSHRRVLHSGGDATGREVVNFILKFVSGNKRIKIFENCFVHNLIVSDGKCFGVCAYDFSADKNLIFSVGTTIIASGGASAIYSRSTNPHTSIGDGITLAYNAGVEIESMEFIQFHPTSFYSKTGETFLISEAVRGEGAYLVNHENVRFLNKQNITELAPRDVVSEAIYDEMKKSGKPNVFLKLDHLDPKKIKSRFFNIYNEAMKFNIDITKDRIPVAPAAHYMVGGIKTSVNAETNVNRLYAIGEVASTGIHGANRLASNSLLECLVFAKRAVDHSQENNFQNTFGLNGNFIFEINEIKQKDFSEVRNIIADLMWNNVGIVRSKGAIESTLSELEKLNSRYSSNEGEYYSGKIFGIIQISELIASAALLREESRGCQLRKDFPDEDPSLQRTIIQQKDKPTRFSSIGKYL